MIEPSPSSVRAERADAWPADGRPSRPRYLPSAQVLTELATLGPDLSRLAADLRDRLSGPSEEGPGFAS